MSEPSPIDAAISRIKAVYTPGPGRASEDPEPDLTDDTPDIELPEHLSWPPPGLEHIHGLLPRITTEFWFYALIMLVPVALATLRDRPPEIGSWGIVVVMIVVGVLLWGAYMRLLVLFNRATSAVRAGYPRQLVWHVAADWARNTPQILRGMESFERLSIAQRARLLDARVWASGFGLAGALWISIGFPVLLAFGAGGDVSARAVWLCTLLPALFLAAVSIYFRVREIRASYENRIPDEEDRHRRQQAHGWSHMYERAGYPLRALDMGSRYRVLGTAAVFAVFLAIIPASMAAFSMVFPLIVHDNIATNSTSVHRAALWPLRAYRLPADSAISAARAGAAYHNLVTAHLGTRPAMLRPASGPALPDSVFPVLGRAARMDFVGARWNLGARDGAVPWRIEPVARGLQEAANARIAAARALMQNGNTEAAEIAVREVIGAGFLVADDAVQRTDALAGLAIVHRGADALADAYRARARGAEADRIAGVLAAAAHATQAALSLAHGSRPGREGLRRFVLREDMPRALRWELFMDATTLANCGSLPNMVFGPGRSHRAFAARAHDALVRFPADEEYFRLAAAGGRCNFGGMRRAMR
jgi:hypothetical protein